MKARLQLTSHQVQIVFSLVVER